MLLRSTYGGLLSKLVDHNNRDQPVTNCPDCGYFCSTWFSRSHMVVKIPIVLYQEMWLRRWRDGAVVKVLSACTWRCEMRFCKRLACPVVEIIELDGWELESLCPGGGHDQFFISLLTRHHISYNTICFLLPCAGITFRKNGFDELVPAGELDEGSNSPKTSSSYIRSLCCPANPQAYTFVK